MPKWLLLASLITLVAISAFFYWPENAVANSNNKVAPSSFLLEKVKSQEWTLIDVRSPEEYAQGHIPGAINMPHDDIERYIGQLGEAKDKPLIIYCRSGRRATIAMKKLEQQEFMNVSHLEGDIMGWRESGLPIDKM
ncbi:rhodanese-like domain-containing protein [Alteromonas sp. C1M14]|uniref:rhodanese-like domain-containing protein n=1 Tax=Alteromonas sp. C1M14 TaxID=2841567 RepID=UPI001C090698|nr:rhodanese-like domain-containing protein [Alteromonas sp. C1M14]MBU2979496.1 rhodanese-like domain-containing protein [Alteromonas sp. C1M14]